MKTFLQLLGFIAVLAFALVPAPVRAQDDTNVSFQTFYDQLADQGTWIQTADYGYVWQPTVNDPSWRPYTYGHWVSTDRGMTWDSDESFGWATYHYGRWVNIADYGWVWVPGYTWAPAWVSWRESDDYYGWAPLPPETLVGVDFYDSGVRVGFGFHIGDDCDVAFGIGPAYYNFCPVAYIGDPYCWRYFSPVAGNFAIINNTVNITNINYNNNPNAGVFGQVRANGPSLARLNARSQTPIQQAQLSPASSLAANGQLQGGRLSTFAPRIDPSTVGAARPQSVAKSLGKTQVNRGTSINQPLAVNSQLKGASPTSQQLQAATQARGHSLTGTKIATAKTQPSRPLTRSLASMHANTVNGQASTTAAVGAGLKPNTSVGANAQSSVTGMPGAKHQANAATSAGSNLTGGPMTRHTHTTSSAESAFTGAPATRHSLAPSSAESSFTGAPTTRHTIAPSRSTEATFSGAPTTRHSLAPSSPSSFHQQSSAPAFHPSSAPAFHQSSAPVQHSGGGFGGGAPAMRSGGGFGGGAPAMHSGGGAPAAHVGGAPSGGGGGRGGSSGNGDKQPH